MEIKIFDSEGTELQPGDLLQLQDKRNGTLTFYATLQVIDGQVFPFNTFSFDRAIKVIGLPAECKHCEAKDGKPEYWMHPQVELALIEEERLDKWRMDTLMFEHNKFFKVVE